MSSIQHGIQPAHTIAEMMVKYMYNSPIQNKIFYDWAKDHKTMIVLDGGYSSSLQELVTKFENVDNNWPWVQFYESKEALDNALTCVSIIIPDYLYDISKLQLESGEFILPIVNDSYSDFDKDLISILDKFKLAV